MKIWEKKAKFAVSLFAAMVMLLLVMPTKAFAAETDVCTVKVGGITLGDNQCLIANDSTTATDGNNGGSYVAYFKDKILYLNGLTVADKGIAMKAEKAGGGAASYELIIILSGTNSVTNATGIAIAGETGWVTGRGMSLTIQGDGSLTAIGKNTGIWVWENITIKENAEVTAIGQDRAGIFNNSNVGTITIADQAQVTANGNTYGIGYDNYYQGSTLRISGGTLIATGNTQALRQKATLVEDVSAQASTDISGTNTEDYNSENNGNYKWFKSVTVPKTPIAGTVTISGDAVYGKTLTANYTGAETVTYKWYRGDSVIDCETSKEYTLTGSDIGKIIKVVVTGAGNYNGTKSAQTATVVQKATPTYVVPAGITANYGDMLEDVTLPAGWAWKDAAAINVGSLGSRDFTAVFTHNDTGYKTVEEPVTVVVQKAPLTIMANNNTITYGDAPANSGVAYSGFVNGETDSILDGTLTYDYNYSQYDNVGSYEITPSGLTAGNYEITFQKGTLTVEQKEIGINWNNTSFIFDGTVQKPTAAATGVVNSDQIELIISGAQTNASDTAYTATVAGIDGAKAINYKLPSNVTTEFTIGKANQSAPTGFTKTDETIFKKADGIITGITANMEYRKDGENIYTGVNSSILENLSAGKYYVRCAADGNHNASPDTEITIGEGRRLKIILPQNIVGYTVTTTGSEIGYGDNADIALTIADGYSKTESFKFYVNGVECSAHLVDGIKYELDGIVSDVNIMVEGIADVTAPTAQIEVVENKWTSFLSNIIFDLFFDETQDITITANDAGSGVNTIEYKLSNNALTETEVREIIAWEGYNGTFKINPDNKYIVYAKITDNAGNVTYISSDGLILDATVAVISGIENNGIYYGDTIVTFTDALAGIDKVAVDSSEVILDDGKYTITADNAEHTITVTDKAGNVVEYKVTVYKNQPGKYTDVTPDTNVGNGKFTETIDKLKEKIPFTQEEKNQIEYGADVEVWLEVKDISNTVSAEDKAKILEKLGNADVAMYLDIVMFKQIGGNTASRLTQLSNNVEITFRLADSDINKDENVTRTYQIIHVHDGEVEVINPVFNAENKTLTFLTDRFSTYAVVYTDVSIESSTDETSSSTEQTTETVETSEVPASNQPPKTGDNSLAGLWIVLMCISGITVSVAVATASKRSLGR